VIVSFIVADNNGWIFTSHRRASIACTAAEYAQMKAEELDGACYLWHGDVDLGVPLFGAHVDDVLPHRPPPIVTASPGRVTS
jgi:hypothetical protein